MDDQSVTVDQLPPATGAQNPPLFPQINSDVNPKPPGVFEQPGIAGPEQNTQNRYSADQTNTTATLATLAQQHLDLAGQGTDGASLKAVINDNKAKIESGGETDLRTQIAQGSKQDAIEKNMKLQSDIASYKEKYTPLRDALTQGLDLQGRPLDPNALEDHGITQLQGMAAQDPDQAALMQTLIKSGGIMHQMHDNAVKMELFGREIDALAERVNNEGWYEKAGDFARGLWPTAGLFASSGNVPGMNHEITDLPSTRENNEASALWGMPLDEFKQKLPATMDNFTKILGGYGHDFARGLEVARTYYNGGLNNSDAMSANFWDAVDVAGVVPVGTLIGIAKTPSKIARIVANRKASADIVAGDLAKDIHGVADPSQAMQGAADSIEESIPSSLAAGAIRPDVGIPADVARRLAETKASVQAAQAVLPKVARLEATQVQQAMESAVKEAQLRYTDDITDFKQDGSTMPTPRGAPKIAEAKARMAAEAAPEAKTGLFDPEADLDHLSFTNARGEVYTGQVPQETGEIGGMRLPHELTKDRDTGIYSLNLYLGKKNTAGGFLTQDGAVAAAERKGFGVYDTHQNSDGQWFVKVKQPVTETGIAQPALTRADFKGYFSPMQYLKSFDNLMPELFNRARLTATLGKSAAIEKVYRPYTQNIRAIGLKSRRLVAKVAAAQEDAQRWFSHAEFEDTFSRGAGRMPTDKESLAFYSARELSDLNWHTFNNEVYIQKARRGLETFSVRNPATGFDVTKANGRLVQNPDFDRLRIYDADEGTHYPPGSATEALKEKFATGKYRVIDLEQAVDKPGEDAIKVVMSHESNSEIRPLQRDQLGYVPGGSRENRFKWFVKQADQREFSDGSTYWNRPITHIAARTHAQAEKWAQGMERARLAYVDKAMSEADKRLIIDASPAESYDRFDHMVQTGKINEHHPFETLFDKETPQAMSKIGDKDVRWFDNSESPQEQYMISKGRMYYSAKGDRLKDPNGDYAEILDPYVTLHRAMENAVQTNAFADYNRKVVEEWVRVSAPYMDRSSLGGNYEPFNVFMNGKLSPDLARSYGGQGFSNQLEMTRNVHKRFMYGQNPEQRLTYQAARKFADWVETKGKWGEYLAQQSYDKMSANPVSAIKGYVFDIHIGMFNPARLWLHTQTAAMAWMQHPVYGTRAFQMLPWVEHCLMNHSENLLDYYAKTLSGGEGGVSKVLPIGHGLEPEDWKNMVRGLRNSGWLNVSSEQIMLDQQMGSIGGSAFKKGVDNVRDAGRIFQNTSERFNRVNAYQIGWHKTRDAFPELSGTDPEFLGRVNREADMLDNNMTTSSQAWWQRGPASIPTQFMAYQTRMLERMLPKMLGGSDQVSAGQKLRLAFGSMLLYGAGGAPGGKEFLDWINTQYANANGGKQMSEDTQRVFGRGVYDTALHYLSGGKLDTDISSRAGLDSFVQDLQEKLTGGKMNSILNVIGGPGGQFLGNVYDAVGKVALYMKAEQTGALDAQTWALLAGDAAQQISTVNNSLKSYWVWKTGQLRDPKSGEPITSEDQMYVITHALGIPSFSEVDRWDLVAHNEERTQHIKDMAKVIANIRRSAFDAMTDGDTQKQEYYNKLASGVMQQFSDDPKFGLDVAQEANRELSRGGFSYDQLKVQSMKKTDISPAE